MSEVSRLLTTFTPTHYVLSLDLDRTGRHFKGTITIDGTSPESAHDIRLHSKDLTITGSHIDDVACESAIHDNDELWLTAPNLSSGAHTVTLTFEGTISDGMHGLYPCYYEHEGQKKELLATQFESHHAREVFPCIDEPEAKAIFDLTLTTEPNITVLGNMPIKEQHEAAGRLVTTFATTPRMSSYLLAWVVGELQKKSATTKDGVEVNVWSTPAQPLESLDFALDIAVKSIEFFNDYFGTEYPLPKSDHVALPDFSSGAMENWGLITYREVALLADPATTSISSKHYIATVIAHELSHQWFGNLVTMKWWNDLWLNESFATLMEYLAVDALEPDWNVWLDFAASESIMALRRDAIDGVQSVQIDVNHPDEISSLFDGAIVYAKGARLLRMLQTYIGKDAFRTGLTDYFKTFAYGNTEASDLWNKLSAASGKDIADFMTSWISQPGYPVLHVHPDGLSQEQFFVGPHQPSHRIWPIPLGASSQEDVPALLETTSLALPIADDERFNVGNTAHFLTHYSHGHLARLLEHIVDLTPLDRLQLLNEQTMLARGNVIASAELISLLDAYKSETDDNVWDIISLIIGELRKFVETDEAAETQLRKRAGKIAQSQYERLGWDAKPNESENNTKLRSTIIGLTTYSEDPDAIRYATDLYQEKSIDDLDPELRPIILSAIVRHATVTDIVPTLLDIYKTTNSAELRADIAAGITSTRKSDEIALLLEQLTDSSVVRSQDVARWFVYLIRGRYGRTATWQWLQDNWSWIETTFSGDKSYDDFPHYAATGLSTREQLAEYTNFFTPKRDIPALTRVIDLGISEITARVELIERDSEAVRSELSRA